MKDKNKNKLALIIFACSIGTILEWYDFSLYAFLTTIISTNFFPTENKSFSILLTYYVFAIGFLVRPLGGIIFGHLGDKINRKIALLISLLLMAITTCLIGLLPTYKDIGITAPIFLMILRILQGLAIGGETIGAGILIIESTPRKKQGFSTALIWASSGIGILVSSILITIFEYIFTSQELSEWAWRLPFFLGALTGITGYFLRKNMFNIIDTVILEKNKFIQFPIVEAVKKCNLEIIIVIALYMLCAITTYILFVYMPVFISKMIGIPLKQAMLINTISMSLMILLVPLIGAYSDKIGRKKILLLSAICFLLLSIPLYVILTSGSLVNLVIAQIMFAIITAGFQGPLTSTVLSIFPHNIRYSSAALGYNLSYSIFGGTAPVIAIYLATKLQNNIAPSFYIILASIVAIYALMNIKEKNLNIT